MKKCTTSELLKCFLTQKFLLRKKVKGIQGYKKVYKSKHLVIIVGLCWPKSAQPLGEAEHGEFDCTYPGRLGLCWAIGAR